jgi:enamine deaminase RidA (YjgF/YER057c/UK114 family)
MPFRSRLSLRPIGTAKVRRAQGSNSARIRTQAEPGAGTEGLPLSEAVRADDFIYISGMVGFGRDGTVVDSRIAAETDRIMADAADILKLVRTTVRDIARVNVYLRDVSNFAAF